MVVSKILLLISLLLNGQGMIASHSEPHLANSLNTSRNVSVAFTSTSFPARPSTYPISSTLKYWTTKSTNTQSQIKNVPECWTQTTPRTTPTARYTAPAISSTTNYIPPCWTQTTPRTTPTARYTPPATSSTTNYIPPCWIQTTPSTVTPPATVTFSPRTTAFPGFECENINSFYSVPSECDTFVECKENVARKHYCPEGLVYKPSTIWPSYPCVLTSEYQCLNGSITQPARPGTECPHQDGYYPVPNSDCSQYIVCQHGIATLMNCPTGLVFNVEKSICDWLINVPSCEPNALKDFKCPSVDETEADAIYKYRYYNSCTYYVACQAGFPRLLSCPGHLRFDAAKQTCIDETYVTDCDI